MKQIILLMMGALMLPVGCGSQSDDTLEASGTIEGVDVRVASMVSGRALALYADEGSAVKQGDTLALIDPADYQIQLRQAVAAAEAAAAGYQLALEGARQEDLIQAEAVLKSAEKDYDRAGSLIASGTITQKQFDDAETRVIAARQSFEKMSTGLREYELIAARAARDQAAAGADQLRKKVADCTIISPASGTVTVRSVERGELVPAGGGLVRVTVLDTVKLTIYVSQIDLASVRLGQPAEVSIDGAPGRTFGGTVVYISDVAEFTPKNVQTKEERTKLVFAVKIRIPNPDFVLKPGMPADAQLDRESGP